MASKHWLWLQTVDRQGIAIRNVDTGSFSDITVDSKTMSGSSAFLSTRKLLIHLQRMLVHVRTIVDDSLLAYHPSTSDSLSELLNRTLLDQIDDYGVLLL